METSFLEQLLLILGVPADKCTITYKHLHRVLNQEHWLGRSALPARSPMHPGWVELGSISDENGGPHCVITGLNSLVAAMNTFRTRQ
jgi:hypothetical protein